MKLQRLVIEEGELDELHTISAQLKLPSPWILPTIWFTAAAISSTEVSMQLSSTYKIRTNHTFVNMGLLIGT